TRLAQVVAAHIVDRFRDGVWFVDLASATDVHQVVATIARSIGAVEPPAWSDDAGIGALAADIEQRCLLLVLDNCEQVVLAVADTVDALLSRCPNARFLTTSRVAIGGRGEIAWRVPPLALPSPSAATGGRLSESVRLFCDRARRTHPEFRLTEEVR